MADTWWRFYNTAPDHPKVLSLTDVQFRAWAGVNSLASKMGGEIPLDMGLIAKTLRKTEGKARDLVQVLLSARLLDLTETGYRPHNWDAKQFKSDTSTERVKRFREGQRNVSETDHRQRHSQKQKDKTDARMARFQEFWDNCPKKTGRGAAEKAWPKATDLSDAETIITAIKAYRATCAGKDPAYIKTPGPWLNEKRWLDEAVVSAVPRPRPTYTDTHVDGWRERVRTFRVGGSWRQDWGPKPGEADCKCPPAILDEREAA